MANVTLTRNLGHDDAGALDLEPAEAREGKSVDVFDDVRDELVLQGLAHEAGENESGLDLSDPEIKKKLQEREVELNLAGGLAQLQQERQQEQAARMEEAERKLGPERDRLRKEREEKGIKQMDEIRNQPPKGPEDQPRQAFGRGFKSEAGTGSPDVEEEEEDETRRRKSQPGTQPAPSQPRPTPPGTPQPAPSQPRPQTAPSKPGHKSS